MYTSCISACFQLFETCFQFSALVFTTFHLFVNFSIPRGADSENKWIWAFVAHFEMRGGENPSWTQSIFICNRKKGTKVRIIII
uniref:Putative ovule protein n=1 Tax=Solanum chacoense TaxID=4108 RepID=A0A0V0IAL8_SOLCH